MAQNRTKPDPLHVALRHGYDAYKASTAGDGEDSAASLADVFGKSRDWLYDIIKGATSFRLVDLPQWIRATGDYSPLEWVCKQVGVIPVRIPQCSDIGCTANTVREFSRYLDGVAQAHEDGRVTSEEARKIRFHGEATAAAILAEVNRCEDRARTGRVSTLREAS